MNIRYLVLITIFASVALGVVGRLTHLHVVQQGFLQAQGEARTLREVKIAAYRGMIRDRNGEALAISTPVDSVWVDPQTFDTAHPNLAKLASILKMPKQSIQNTITSYAQKGKEFVYLKRQVEPGIGKQVKDLNIAGLHIMPEYRRFYPNADVAAHVLGVTDIDDRGLEGLELSYNKWLTGTSGKKRVVQDLHGNQVEDLGVVQAVQPGNDLTLSLDQRLQYLAHKELQAALTKHNAASGSVVVIDVNTGEVLAMVNGPSFNPNQRARKADSKIYRNLAVTDAFEPGSVFKAFSVASVLEHTRITPNTTVNTKPGYLKLPGGVVRDVHNNGVLDVASVLRTSSNIGMSKLVLNLKPQQLLDTYERLGFGWSTNSGFPGENPGMMQRPRDNQSFVLATMSFGYGLAVTPLQLAQAYAIIGAGGVKYPVSFVKASEKPAGVRVMDAKVARQVLDMLSYAVGHGASNARVAGYNVAGKTGTARIAGPNGYTEDKYRAVFAGLAPAVNPKVAIVVTINEPSAGEYYSNQVAAPVFAKVASGVLRLYKISPDLLDTYGVQVAHNGNAD